MLVELSDVKLAIGGRPILDGVALHMEEGEIYGLVGPNGAGKSTTISVVTGLRMATNGHVRVFDRDPIHDGIEVRRKIGVMPEKGGFYGWMTAREYLNFFGRLYDANLAGTRVTKLLDQVGLVAPERQLIGTYSHGMKQRLGLARALLHKPRLLVLDEPTSGLDPRGRREIHDVLIDLSQNHGVGVLLCTHLLDDVDRLCRRIGVINGGRTVAEGNVTELLAAGNQAPLFHIRLASMPASPAPPAGARIVGQKGEWLLVELDPGKQPADIWRHLFANGWPIVEIRDEGGGLEELYLRLTQAPEQGVAA